jgi:hypothetical protein
MLENLSIRKYNTIMIIEIIIKEIQKSEKSRYQIAKETGISEAILCKVLHGKQTVIETRTADILLKYFNYKIVKDGE